ncbi:PLP-dependent cysteine synthase family protein [Maricaulis sp. CAU 1757]
MIGTSILQRIGGTPLFELSSWQAEGGARILVKLEAENPTGSMKDRMALAMVEAARADGRLKPGQRVVEYTGGSTGVSLAFVCAVLGHPLSIVTADAFSLEKRRHMAAFGAELTVLETADGGMDASLTRRMVETAGEIAEATGAFWTDQLNNKDQVRAYHRFADEILDALDAPPAVFVQATGTAASVRGTAERLAERATGTRIVAVEPAESAVLSGGPSGSHRIEGVGAGFVVPLWRPELVDRIVPVSTEMAMQHARRLARQDGLFAGTSTGANLAAAVEMARELRPEETVVTVMCDSGLKYLSTALYGG